MRPTEISASGFHFPPCLLPGQASCFRTIRRRAGKQTGEELLYVRRMIATRYLQNRRADMTRHIRPPQAQGAMRMVLRVTAGPGRRTEPGVNHTRWRF